MFIVACREKLAYFGVARRYGSVQLQSRKAYKRFRATNSKDCALLFSPVESGIDRNNLLDDQADFCLCF